MIYENKYENMIYLIKIFRIHLFSVFILLSLTNCNRNADHPNYDSKTNRGFITLWELSEGEKEITIPINGEYYYNYNIYWSKEDDPSKNGGISNITRRENYKFELPESGKYTVEITGKFPAIYFNPKYTDLKRHNLIDVKQWGDIEWESMEHAFSGCNNLQITATDKPNLSKVKSLKGMFLVANSFNGSINHWDVSNITDMSDMFNGAAIFNQPLNSWNISNVTNMEGMFWGAKAFNQPLNSWNISNVTKMKNMFYRASSFDQDLNNWKLNEHITSENTRPMFSSHFNENNIKSWRLSLKDLTNEN